MQVLTVCLVCLQVTQSEGQPVRQAKAWCTMIGVPHYRFSPQLMEEVITSHIHLSDQFGKTWALTAD